MKNTLSNAQGCTFPDAVGENQGIKVDRQTSDVNQDLESALESEAAVEEFLAQPFQTKDLTEEELEEIANIIKTEISEIRSEMRSMVKDFAGEKAKIADFKRRLGI
jgi:hypothetical protein